MRPQASPPEGSNPPGPPITELLRAWRQGREGAEESLMPVVWAELHRLARIHSGGQDKTLQPTALVNEAYLKLVAGDSQFKDRLHFFAFAARVMRSVMVDHLRAQRRQKRGGDRLRVTWDEALDLHGADSSEDFLRLDEALRALEKLDPRKAQVVELRYFSGLNYDETAELLGTSKATVNRELRLARAWLRAEIAGDS